jgi:crotonobetainyl-CoA:carnitine CoA-transferase CaiB-like acyl-CoA transferase
VRAGAAAGRGDRVAEHLAGREFFPSVQHPVAGRGARHRQPLPSGRARPVHPRGPAPHNVGENTRTVLGGLLGYDPQRIASLLTSGAVSAP